MSIDLLIAGPANRDTGGVARFVTEQQRALPEDVVPRVYDIRTPPGSGWRRFCLAVAVALLDAVRFPFRSRPDVLHVHTSYGLAFYRAAYYVFVGKLLWRRPVVLHVHGSAFDTFLATAGRIEAILQTLIFGRCDRVIALSAYWKSVLRSRVPPHRIVVVPNAVDPDEYDPSTRTDPPTVTFVSNLVERKGVPELVAAIDRLERNGTAPFAVEIAGDGPLAEDVRALAAAHDNVSYHGYVSERRKRDLLESGAVFVLPTRAEGLPIALLEGMAGGNAVISTRVGSIPEVLETADGALVDPGDVDALVETLQSILETDDIAAMGERNHETVAQRYSWDIVGERLASTYRELV